MTWSLLLLVAVAFAIEDCGKNEHFYPCGPCDSPCARELVCAPVCTEGGGCGCLPGYRRNDQGACIPRDECPTRSCQANETFYPCGTCDGSCQDPTPPCSLICKLDGTCSCNEGYVRNGEGDCVLLADCPAPKKKCGANEQFYPCGACDSPCGVDMTCAAACRPPGECGCLPGHKRDETGLCIPSEKCRCGPNEIFYRCGPCDRTCRSPEARCPRTCLPTGGCGCRPGFVRNDLGHCIREEWCHS